MYMSFSVRVSNVYALGYNKSSRRRTLASPIPELESLASTVSVVTLLTTLKYKQQGLALQQNGNAGMALQQVANTLQQKGLRVHHVLAPQSAVAVDLSSADLAALQADPAVEYVEEDHKRYPMAQQVPFGYTMVQADQVSDQFASNQKVCVIDSGLDLPHEDFLSGNITGTNDSGTGNWFDNGGPHGTHVAGTIAAMNNNVGIVGVLPNGNVKLHIVKVFNEAGWGYSSTLASAVNTCVSNGSTVINMSLGGAGSSTTESNAMQAAFDQGVLLIAAAGNDGNTAMSYPASYNSVISVAAIDKNKQLADFSQRNSQVELAAPGVDIRSTYPEGTGRIEAGAYVEVKGSLVGGVLVATRVKLENNTLAGNEFELHGTISNAATSVSLPLEVRRYS